MKLRRRGKRLLLRVGALVLVAAVTYALHVRSSGKLPLSPTCDNVPPGGSRVRSLPPSAGSSGSARAPKGNEDRSDVEPAFRPKSARLVYCEDFADPFVLRRWSLLGYRLFAYATNTARARIPVLSSADGLRSEELGDVLPELPAWSRPGGVWGPAVLPRRDMLVLYYTTTDRASGRQCISVAVGKDPEGPFLDRSTSPLVCPIALGGAIDPSPFLDAGGRPYLLWKNDGNCCGVPTRIWSQRLSEDGRRVVAPAQPLLGATEVWEGSVVEAPAMTRRGGTYYLFYSANAWNTTRYAIGYATCRSPEGPCTKPLRRPWLASSPDAEGPGGQELFRDGAGRLRMVFHAWTDNRVGYRQGGFRSLFTAGVGFADGVPVTTE